MHQLLSYIFTGIEISGIIHDVGNSLPNSNFTPGDKVILFPDDNIVDSGYTEYLAVEDSRCILQVPQNMPLEVAAMLPGGALSAYAAVLAAKPHVEKLQQVKCKWCSFCGKGLGGEGIKIFYLYILCLVVVKLSLRKFYKKKLVTGINSSVKLIYNINFAFRWLILRCYI